VASTQTASVWIGALKGKKLAVKIAEHHAKPLGDHILHEARILSKLRGVGGVPQLVWQGDLLGRPSLAYDWIEGINLRMWPRAQKIKKSTWDAFEAILISCHREGVVHGDIKAGNCLLSPDEAAYLVDFGKSRLSSRQGLTHDWHCFDHLKANFDDPDDVS